MKYYKNCSSGVNVAYIAPLYSVSTEGGSKPYMYRVFLRPPPGSIRRTKVQQYS